MFKPLYQRAIHAFTRRMPAWYFSVFYSPLLRLPSVTQRVKQHVFESYRDDDGRISSGWASLAKVSCSDLAIRNFDLAMQLMGADGLRHDAGAEKPLRDAKLLQIYEGTNQLNRLNLLKNMVVWEMPEARVFE